jgi:hypothetical protein
VPIYSPLYAATEGTPPRVFSCMHAWTCWCDLIDRTSTGLLGVNLDPSGSAYYLVPSNMFIEFIELSDSDQDQVLS